MHNKMDNFFIFIVVYISNCIVFIIYLEFTQDRIPCSLSSYVVFPVYFIEYLSFTFMDSTVLGVIFIYYITKRKTAIAAILWFGDYK